VLSPPLLRLPPADIAVVAAVAVVAAPAAWRLLRRRKRAAAAEETALRRCDSRLKIGKKSIFGIIYFP
jgi:hypothetical protein